MKYLFVCLQNQMRSPIVAEYFRDLLKEKNIEAIVESAGLLDSSPKKLTKDIVEGADVIFVMDDEVYHNILEKYSPPLDKIINLDILDVYFNGVMEESMVKYLYEDEWRKLENTPEKRNEFYDKICGRPEIKHKLTLKDVLEIKKCCFEHFIK